MSLNEHLEPGIYIDGAGDDIWRKAGGSGNWTVNGQPWQPFPKSLVTLRTLIAGPAVSIGDVVNESS